MLNVTFLNFKENTLFPKKSKMHFGEIFTCNFPFSLFSDSSLLGLNYHITLHIMRSESLLLRKESV